MKKKASRRKKAENKPACSWIKKDDGIIYFSITTDGTTGPEWIKRLGRNGFEVSRGYAESVLCSPDFNPTSGVTYNVVIIPCRTLRESGYCTTAEAEAEAERRGFVKPGAEIACLVREIVSIEDLKNMGFSSLKVMHEPIRGDEGKPSRLYMNRDTLGSDLKIKSDAKRWLHSCKSKPDNKWDRGYGFVFIVPQPNSDK